MTALLLFASTFAVVFALGLQSLNVNGGHRLMAFVTSFAIGGSNLVLFKVMPGPTDWMEIAAYLLGGPFGIVASMLAHPHLVRLMARKSPAPRPAAPPTEPPDAQPRKLCQRLLDPEDLGWAATQEVRNAARAALGKDPVPIPAPLCWQRRPGTQRQATHPPTTNATKGGPHA